MKSSAGFTLQEMIIALGLSAIIAAASVPAYMNKVKEEQETKAVQQGDALASSYKRFRAQERRNPSSINELINSPHYTGSAITPWGSNISGASVSEGRGYQFTLPAKDTVQAERLAMELQHYGATAAGSLVTFSAPMSTIEAIEEQMLCRRDIGVADCNKLEVALDVGDQDILNANNIEGVTGRLQTVVADDTQIKNLTTEDEIVLGANSITHAGRSIIFNADETVFDGDVSMAGNLVGNNSTISGVAKIEADTLVSTSATIENGVISQLQGSSLDYDSGSFNDVDAVSTTAEIGDFQNATTQRLDATDFVSTSFSGQTGTVTNLTAQSANGGALSLSGTMTVNEFQSQFSSIGTATGSNLTLAGQATANYVLASGASFNSLTVTGDVSGGTFRGTDFITSVSSLNSNRSLINSNKSKISSNASQAQTNKNKLSSLESKISSQESTIAANRSRSLSNRSTAQSNASKITRNANDINSLEYRAGRIENDVASLSSQLQTCKSQGGCSW